MNLITVPDNDVLSLTETPLVDTSAPEILVDSRMLMIASPPIRLARLRVSWTTLSQEENTHSLAVICPTSRNEHRGRWTS